MVGRGEVKCVSWRWKVQDARLVRRKVLAAGLTKPCVWSIIIVIDAKLALVTFFTIPYA